MANPEFERRSNIYGCSLVCDEEDRVRNLAQFAVEIMRAVVPFVAGGILQITGGGSTFVQVAIIRSVEEVFSQLLIYVDIDESYEVVFKIKPFLRIEQDYVTQTADTRTHDKLGEEINQLVRISCGTD
jgi:hypothetical protein